MTIADDSEAVTVEDVPERVSVEAAGKDWLLQKLVNIVNAIDGLHVGITLQVSGMLVSGSLMGGKQYFKEFDQVFSGGFGNPDISSSFAGVFDSYAEMYNDLAGDSEECLSPQFIHLKDVRFFNVSGRPIPHNSGVLWRGKIDSVGGFFLGVLSA